MISKILMPTDGSPTAHAAADFALEIAKAEHAEIEVLGVVHTVVAADTANVDTDAAAEPGVETIVDAQVAELKAGGATVSGRIVVGGRVHEAIVDVAKEDGADIIVMGTHGRTGLARTMIGSVADRVLRHSEVPVLMVPKKA